MAGVDFPVQELVLGIGDQHVLKGGVALLDLRQDQFALELDSLGPHDELRLDSATVDRPVQFRQLAVPVQL